MCYGIAYSLIKKGNLIPFWNHACPVYLYFCIALIRVKQFWNHTIVL